MTKAERTKTYRSTILSKLGALKLDTRIAARRDAVDEALEARWQDLYDLASTAKGFGKVDSAMAGEMVTVIRSEARDFDIYVSTGY